MFSPDGQWVGFWAAGKLQKVPLAGGPAVQLCDAAAIFGASWGRAVVFTILKGAQRWDDTQVVVRSLTTGQQSVLIEGGADGRYVPTGHLVYVRLGALMAAPFDPDRLAVTGGATGLVDGVMQAANRS